MFISSNNYTSLLLVLYIRTYMKSINVSYFLFFFTHLSLSETRNSNNRISIIISHDKRERERLLHCLSFFFTFIAKRIYYVYRE